MPHDAYLETVIPLVAGYDLPLAVVDGAGAQLGYVDRALVLRALCVGNERVTSGE